MACTWDVDRGCLPDLPEPDADDYDAAVDQQNMAVDTAVMVLYQLTAQQFGLCPVMARPCPTPSPRCYPGMRPYTQELLFWDGAHWFNGSCGCAGRCQLDGPGVVHLPGPVDSVTAVTIGDVVLDESEYTVEGDRLYRRGGKAWPSQNLGRPLGESGTWGVEYVKGYPPPAGADKMAGMLALEFLNACDGSECRIPRSVIQTSSRGVTHTFDATKMLANGKVGIPEIDLWLNAINPYHLLRAPSVI